MPIISPLNKYWIDESTLSDLTDYQKALFIQNVDKAAAEWNSVRIADCDGAIIKLERQSSNGLNVVPIRYNPNLDSNVAGQFNPIPLFHEIEIKRYNDYDTIMYEFGHMIGLQDLDLNNSPGTHISLMGYNSDDILHYQDIQGLAVAMVNILNMIFENIITMMKCIIMFAFIAMLQIHVVLKSTMANI